MSSRSRMKHQWGTSLRDRIADQLHRIALRLRTSRRSRKPERAKENAKRHADLVEVSKASRLLISLARSRLCRLHKQEAKRAVALGSLSKDLLRLGFPRVARHVGRLSFVHWRRSRRLAAEIRSEFSKNGGRQGRNNAA